MYLVLVCGGIASGKSSVARHLEALGATRLDLDEITHEIYEVGSPVLGEVARTFGADVLDEDGALRRGVLAARAFATPADARRLEAIVHPEVTRRLMKRLGQGPADGVAVVEVPLLDRVEALAEAADEVLVVACPQDLRRVRAIGRGMRGEDFDARARLQPTDDWLCAHATTTVDNTGTVNECLEQVDAWWAGLDARRASACDGRNQ
jgi:dephospho-CoA kinase